MTVTHRRTHRSYIWLINIKIYNIIFEPQCKVIANATRHLIPQRKCLLSCNVTQNSDMRYVYFSLKVYIDVFLMIKRNKYFRNLIKLWQIKYFLFSLDIGISRIADNKRANICHYTNEWLEAVDFHCDSWLITVVRWSCITLRWFQSQ